MTRPADLGILQLAPVVELLRVRIVADPHAHRPPTRPRRGIQKDRPRRRIAVIPQHRSLARRVRQPSVRGKRPEALERPARHHPVPLLAGPVIAVQLPVGRLHDRPLRPGPGQPLHAPRAVARRAAPDDVAAHGGDDQLAGREADAVAGADRVPGPAVRGQFLGEIDGLGPGVAVVSGLGEVQVSAAFPGGVDFLGDRAVGEDVLAVLAVGGAVPREKQVDGVVVVDDRGRIAPGAGAGADDFPERLPVGRTGAVVGGCLGALVDKVDVAKVLVGVSAALGEGEDASGGGADHSGDAERVEADSGGQFVWRGHVGAAEEREFIVVGGGRLGRVVDGPCREELHQQCQDHEAHRLHLARCWTALWWETVEEIYSHRVKSHPD